MLNGRLYLQAWLVAVVALLVAFLTLEPPDEVVRTDQVATFNSAVAADTASDLASVAPERVPGSPGADAAASWIEGRFRGLPDGERRVATQAMVARVGGERIPLKNVFFTLPARAPTKSQRNIVIVAPRDAPRGVTAGTTSSAILVELARTASRTSYRHTIIFLSVDGGTIGNAGTRWYLRSVDRTRIAGVIVLDAPGEGDGRVVRLWSSGAGRQALAIRQLADQAVRNAGFEPSALPSLREQLLRLAVPETRGEQRAAIDLGVPAVTLADREESPLPAGPVTIQRERIGGAGRAALWLVNLLDVRERANVPDAALAYAGKILRPAVGRLALLLLALPLLVMALDAAARVRRGRIRVSAGLRAVAWRFVTPLVVLFLAHLLSMWGIFRGPDIGRPPKVVDLHLDGQAWLGILLLLLMSAVVWLGVRPRVLAAGASPSAEAAGALIWLALLTLLAWWVAPFSLVLILPAAHAALAATVVPRQWQIGALAVLALAGPIAIVLMTAADIDRSPLFAVWYLCQTAVSGARGLAGPVLGAAVGVCVVSLSTLVAFRARKGLVAGRASRAVRARR
jgi:hypothetical protein